MMVPLMGAVMADRFAGGLSGAGSHQPRTRMGRWLCAHHQGRLPRCPLRRGQGTGQCRTPHSDRILRENNEKMRQEFTANVSHELKTPLTSISGYAELIETGIAKPEDVPDFGRKIHSDIGAGCP